MPIIIWDTKDNIESCKRLINKYEFIYLYVDDPKNADWLKNLNVSEAYHVLIISKIEEAEVLDFDAILLANYLQEWYPSVRFTVEFKNEKSIKMIESTVFDNKTINETIHYTKSFMDGTVFNSPMFLDIGSKLRSDPSQLQLLNDLLHNNAYDSNLITLSVDK